MTEKGGSEAGVWRALSSSHRRRLLDLLRDGPRTTADLTESMGGLSRFAVMQHLGVLEEARLVLVRRRGRERYNHLNAVPLRRVYERWVSTLADNAAGSLLALGRVVGSEGDGEMSKTVRIENEISLAAPVERVFKALTEEQHKWYPYSYGGERLRTIAFEPRVGGQCFEDWGDGAGHLYGHVWHYDPPRSVTIRGFLHPAVNLEQSFVVEAAGDGCVLKQTLVAFGDISDDDAEQIRFHGDLTKIESKLRDWVESDIEVVRV